jgi:O-methyltransferase
MGGSNGLVARATTGDGVMDPKLAVWLRTAWGRLPFHRLLAWALPHAPRGLRSWVQLRKEHIRVAAGDRLVPEVELELKYREALQYLIEKHGVRGIGDYVEFGVYHGASMACMYRASHSLGLDGMRLFGFDSFEGLPAAAAEPESGGVWSAGQFAIGERFARQFLTRAGVDWSRVTLVKGWFTDTLTQQLVREHHITKASVIMVDSDLYSSAKDALRFCAPLIRDEAIVFFDDWEASPDADLGDRNLGERRAYAEWLEQQPDLAADRFGSYQHTEMSNPARGEIVRVWRSTAQPAVAEGRVPASGSRKANRRGAPRA